MARRDTEGPRSIAYRVLSAVDEKEAFADRALDAGLRRASTLPDADRRLATEIVYGTLRRRGTLDRSLRPFLRKPPEQLDPEVLRILRIGAYQILFLDRVPDHAAVNESVNLAGRFAPRGSSSFVNAALRALCRARKEGEEIPLQHALAAPSDFPAWLTRIWERELGAEKTGEMMEALLCAPQTVLRTNTRRTDRSGLIERLAREGHAAEPVGELPQAVRLCDGGDIRGTECYRQGFCVQQDGASQLVVEILAPKPGERVLDLCAAPGIKTTHVAEKMADTGLIVAVDSHLGRLRELAAGCRRMGVKTARPLCADGCAPRHALRDRPAFDRILVDAPCSGLGILRRNPEKKWRPPPDFATLTRLQAGLLRTAASLVRPGGVLVYSTCTVHREENEAIVEGLVSERGDFVLEEAAPFLPGPLRDLGSGTGYFRSWVRPASFDLFFAARLRRVSRRRA